MGPRRGAVGTASAELRRLTLVPTRVPTSRPDLIASRPSRSGHLDPAISFRPGDRLVVHSRSLTGAPTSPATGRSVRDRRLVRPGPRVAVLRVRGAGPGAVPGVLPRTAHDGGPVLADPYTARSGATVEHGRVRRPAAPPGRRPQGARPARSRTTPGSAAGGGCRRSLDRHARVEAAAPAAGAGAVAPGRGPWTRPRPAAADHSPGGRGAPPARCGGVGADAALRRRAPRGPGGPRGLRAGGKRRRALPSPEEGRSTWWASGARRRRHHHRSDPARGTACSRGRRLPAVRGRHRRRDPTAGPAGSRGGGVPATYPTTGGLACTHGVRPGPWLRRRERCGPRARAAFPPASRCQSQAKRST